MVLLSRTVADPTFNVAEAAHKTESHLSKCSVENMKRIPRVVPSYPGCSVQAQTLAESRITSAFLMERCVWDWCNM